MTVVLEQGTLQGLHYKTRLSNKSYVSFLGIPYALPPIKDLRFKVRIFNSILFQLYIKFMNCI